MLYGDGQERVKVKRVPLAPAPPPPRNGKKTLNKRLPPIPPPHLGLMKKKKERKVNIHYYRYLRDVLFMTNEQGGYTVISAAYMFVDFPPSSFKIYSLIDGFLMH